MVRVIIFISSLLITAEASARTTSAYRDPNESGLTYRFRAHTESQLNRLFHFPGMGPSAEESLVRYGGATLPHPAAWESEEIMQQRFEAFRDLRFLDDADHPGFARRTTWLYPKDGCFARAAMAIKTLADMGAALPSTIFVFGTLQVQTPNSEDGSVTWYFHVAPIVEVAGVAWVLDPAVEPRQPLKLDDWLGRMSKAPADLQVAICGSGTYLPEDSCGTFGLGDIAHQTIEQHRFFGPEWSLLLSLHRDPEKELGDSPPWKSEQH